MDLVPNISYFLLSHRLSTSPITTLLILTNTFSFTSATDLPNIKTTLPITLVMKVELVINFVQRFKLVSIVDWVR